MLTKVLKSLFVVLLTAPFAIAANPSVNVDVSTPNVRVQVGTPQAPPAPQLRVVERERIVVREDQYKGKKDRGKHKGHYKKHKKNGKHDY